MNTKGVCLFVAASIACISLSGCDWSWLPWNWGSGGGTATTTLNITVSGGDMQCPLANVRLSNASVKVSTSGGYNFVEVSVDVACVMSGTRNPMPGVTLGVSGVPLQEPPTLGPTDENGHASGRFTSETAASSLSGQSAELRVVGSDGNAHSTSPAATVTVTEQQ